MACRSPITFLHAVVPCGRCMPCRKQKAFDWSNRQDLEASHQRLALGRASSFLTLTYSDEHLPSGSTLAPEHLQRFLRTLRQRVERAGGHELRFYACGEYGEKTARPHYHLNIFGYAPTDHIGALTLADHARAAWGRGFIKALPYLQGAASYTSGYVVKGLYQAHNPRLAGRHPEFRRASRRPGLAAPALDLLGRTLAEGGYCTSLEPAAPSPESADINGRAVRLRGYMLKRLRRSIGFSTDELREVGRSIVTAQAATIAAHRSRRLDEDHGDRVAGGNPNVLATAAAIYRELNAAALDRLEATHHRIEAQRKRTF